MATDYDRLFAPAEGGQIPDAAGSEPDFDIDSDFDIDLPATAPPMPTSPFEPNVHAPQPMPVDWNQQPPPARPETPRPPVDYERIFEPSEGIEIPDEAGGSDFDVNSGFDGGAPPMPTNPPPPNGHALPHMPVDWGHQPPSARPQTRRPPMPVDRNGQPPPPRPKPPTIEPGPPPAAQSRPPRRARQDPRDPEAPRGQTAHSPHSHRAGVEHNRGKPAPTRMPARPRADTSVPSRNGGPTHAPPPVSSTGNVAAQQNPAMTPMTVDQHASGAVSHIAVKPAKKSAAKLISRRGWRRWVHKLTRINVGLSRAQKYDLDVRDRIRRSPRGAYQIAILGLKGGVGKTTVTVTLGSVFAQVRRDRVLAFDADASCGNLADRAGRQSGATIADLLADKDLTHYNDVRTHTSANAVNLEVLPGQDYSTARRAFSEADWHYAADAVSRFYNLVLADCGAGLFDPVTRGVLSTAAAVVIVTNASIDGARQAAVAIDWMRNNGHQDLLSRACVVINNVSAGETNIAVAELVRQFEQYVQPGRVIVLPWDKHIAAGTEIQLSLAETPRTSVKF